MPPKRQKKDAKYLAMMAHPVPKDKVYICGKGFLFSYSLAHIAFLAFTFGYIDANTVIRFDIFASAMTGNAVNLAIFLSTQEYNQAGFEAVIIFCHLVLGTWLSCFILEWVQSYKMAYAIISATVCVACLCVDVFEAEEKAYGTAFQKREFFVASLAISMGMMMHWCGKLGFVVLFITANGQKLVESGYKLCFKFYQGGAKLRGDATTILIIVLMFIAGSIAGAFATQALANNDYAWSLIPVTCTYPLHLWLAGCIEIDITAWFKRACCPKKEEDGNEGDDEDIGIEPDALESDQYTPNPLINSGKPAAPVELTSDCDRDEVNDKFDTLTLGDMEMGQIDEAQRRTISRERGNSTLAAGESRGRGLSAPSPKESRGRGLSAPSPRDGSTVSSREDRVSTSTAGSPRANKKQQQQLFSVGQLSTQDVLKFERHAQLVALMASGGGLSNDVGMTCAE